MARRFARRRRPRVAWLPTFGDTFGTESVQQDWANGIRYELDVPGGFFKIVDDITGVTFDAPAAASAVQIDGPSFGPSLHDLVQGESYRLRRIVGKFFGQVDITENPTNICALDVALGFIVLRTTANGGPSDFIHNPLHMDTMDDPWIWRRRWILSTSTAWTEGTPWKHMPRSTAGFHSVADGPHIDQKTARVIAPQERLFAAVAARVLDTADGLDPTGEVRLNAFLDYRILASMRQNIGNRGNASR